MPFDLPGLSPALARAAHALNVSLELQAVLDTNIWLATHVVIVTLGYASTYVAGFLAMLYVVRGVFTPCGCRKQADECVARANFKRACMRGAAGDAGPCRRMRERQVAAERVPDEHGPVGERSDDLVDVEDRDRRAGG